MGEIVIVDVPIMFFRVNISETTQLFKIYMKKSQNDSMTRTKAA